MSQKINLGIFSSSRCVHNQDYISELESIANKLPNNYEICYGGGDSGAMGIIPKSFADRGGKVHAIDCKKFYDKYGGVSFAENTIYDTFEERQQQLITKSDVILCLPGGIGTLSELMDVLVLNDLSIKTRKVILFNWGGLFNPIIDFINTGIEQKFITNWEKLNIIVVSSADAVIENLNF